MERSTVIRQMLESMRDATQLLEDRVRANKTEDVPALKSFILDLSKAITKLLGEIHV